MKDVEQFAKDLIQKMAAAANTDLTGLARLGGLAPSTLTRFVNGEGESVPSMKTFFKLSKASGVPIVAGNPPPDPSKSANIEAVAAVAKVLGVDLSDIGVRSGVELTSRQFEWLEVIGRLPATSEHYAFTTLSGLVDSLRAAEKQPEPGKAKGVRRQG